MKRRIITTADGSHSLYVEGLDEHYHSVHGALQESRHVFIKTGLDHIHEQGGKKISILEIGFGTGLNALLTWLKAGKLEMQVEYTGLEAFPLEPQLLAALNYIDAIGQSPGPDRDEVSKKYFALHQAAWEDMTALSENFKLRKIHATLQEIKFGNTFDLIYFDAFGPRVQPEMWTDEIFGKIYAATNPGGVLVTYCSKGEVQRCMKRAGFNVTKMPGPPGKREMLRASRQ